MTPDAVPLSGFPGPHVEERRRRNIRRGVIALLVLAAAPAVIGVSGLLVTDGAGAMTTALAGCTCAILPAAIALGVWTHQRNHSGSRHFVDGTVLYVVHGAHEHAHDLATAEIGLYKTDVREKRKVIGTVPEFIVKSRAGTVVLPIIDAETRCIRPAADLEALAAAVETHPTDAWIAQVLRDPAKFPAPPFEPREYAG